MLVPQSPAAGNGSVAPTPVQPVTVARAPAAPVTPAAPPRPVLARAPLTAPAPASRPAPARLTLAREESESGSSSGGGGGGGGGSDSDTTYDEVLRRLRQEQEQLGQLIPHPF